MSIFKNKYNKHSWNKWLSVLSSAILAIAFLKDAWDGGALSIWAYLTFPAGALICYSPVMANKIIASTTILIEAIAKMKGGGGKVETTTSTTPQGETTTSTTATQEKV
jgi:uncharacterized membrane protein YjjP (DUF1212 family)